MISYSDNIDRINSLLVVLIAAVIIWAFVSVNTDKHSYNIVNASSDASNFSEEGTFHSDYTSRPEDLDTTLKEPDISAWITEGGRLEGYMLETNSKGFREEDFKVEKPEDQYRIVVLGDSQTMGWGVNASDRYTDLLEQRLDRKTSKNVQILNLAMPGHGFEDFHEVFVERAKNYDPDVVMVSYGSSSLLSVSDQNEIHENISRDYERELNFSERQKIYFERVRKLLNSRIKSKAVLHWGNKFSEEANASIIFYEYSPTDSSLDSSEINNFTLIRGPSNIGRRHIISDTDPHFNSRGHRRHAEHLEERLGEKLFSDSETRFSIQDILQKIGWS